MTQSPRVVFLHIPKTAGQSVHTYLHGLFGPDAIAPARVNTQLFRMSVPEIRRYRVYSGHLDWCLLDCLPEPRFVFTILRDPMDRILSFYLYLREEATRLSPEELAQPHHQGMHAALTLTPDEYFVSPKNKIRTFLDNHYDNFYANYLAGRSYDARQRLLGLRNQGLDENRLLELAVANLSSLSRVYVIDRLDQLEADLVSVAGPGTTPPKRGMSSTRVNVGDGGTREQRMERLRELGATNATFQRIAAMTRLDNVIWQMAQERAALSPAA